MTNYIGAFAMNISKPWYLSRTIWASLVTVALSIGELAGLSVESLDAGALSEALVLAATALCGLVAILGRIRATDRIG